MIDQRRYVTLYSLRTFLVTWLQYDGQFPPLIATILPNGVMSMFLGCTAMLGSPRSKGKEETLTSALRLLFVNEIELFV